VSSSGKAHICVDILFLCSIINTMPGSGWLTLGDGSPSGPSYPTPSAISTAISTPAGATDTSPTSSPLAAAGDTATPSEAPAASIVYTQPSPPPSTAAKPEPTITGSSPIDLEEGTMTVPPPTPTIVTINGKISTETPTEPAAAIEETPTPIVTVINGKATTITPVPSLVAASRSLTDGYFGSLTSSANPTATNGIPTVVTIVAGGKSYTETLIYQSSSLSGYLPAGGYVLLSINESNFLEIYNFMLSVSLFLYLELINPDI
jgi:hypothetical protein